MIYPQGEPVQPPTTTGGFEGEVQPPFTEGFSLNGPADDGVLPNVPPKVGPTHSPGFSLEEPGAFGDGVLTSSSTKHSTYTLVDPEIQERQDMRDARQIHRAGNLLMPEILKKQA